MKIEIKKKDLKIRTFRASGPGGQHRNKTESAVEITHIPTGIKATSTIKSQHRNKQLAMRVLLSRLAAHYRKKTERYRAPSERVRTYHQPDNRVTDHASGFEQSYVHVVEKGNIGEMVESRARKLSNG